MNTYSFSMRFMHWSAAVIVILALLIGVMIGYDLVDGKSEIGGILYSLHVSLGVLAILFMATRLVVRQASPRPAVKGGRMAQRLAGSVHGLLYILALGVPLLGYAMDLAYGGVPALFGMAMPDFGWLAPAGSQHPVAETLYYLHSYGGHVLAFLITAHVAAAIWRTLKAAPGEIDGLRRMWGPASKDPGDKQGQP
jgi:cytochrome b561